MHHMSKTFLDRTHTSKPCEMRLVAHCPYQSLSFREGPAVPEHKCTMFMSRQLHGKMQMKGSSGLQVDFSQEETGTLLNTGISQG